MAIIYWLVKKCKFFVQKIYDVITRQITKTIFITRQDKTCFGIMHNKPIVLTCHLSSIVIYYKIDCVSLVPLILRAKKNREQNA